ncbi:histidine kinase [Novimethylophilus kurashikiensis]|uniref:histidine kinase n=1 Tax=Novimethylophilus kurashikiensis TaxID=1825523 RepID=A0A2R5F9T4_9PROT|nr:PAS domain S-box protein [Novimethylophilus kurashikiensis]GBG14957.1 histidine kinase [Novimethylophilus kurashikiensis]
MSLRFRLNLLITVLLLIFMAGVGFVILKDTRTSIKEGVEAAGRVTTQLLDTVIVSSYRNPELGPTHEVLKTFLESLGHVRSLDISLYDGSSHLIYLSPPSTYRTDEEPPAWFVKLVAPEQEVSVRRIRFGQLVLTSNPGGAIREAWTGVRNLFMIWLGFFVLLNSVVYWMLGRALTPVNSILRAINRMEHGDLAVRLPGFPLPEYNRIAQSFNNMAASLEASTMESRRLALVVKQTGDAIMIHDLNGNISLWNPAAERMFGYAAEDIIGKSAELLTPPGRENELRQNLAAIAERRPIYNYDTQRVTRSGRLLDVALSAAPLIDPQHNKVVGEICTLRDITERKHAEEAERKLEENRQLTQLIQSHIEEERRSLARELHDELGQYVTAIKTFAVAISNKAKAQMPEIEGAAQTIAAAANHIYDGMHNIIRQLRPGALDNLGLTETLRDAVTNWQGQYPEIEFDLAFSGKLGELGEMLNINLYRIVQESVTNALRYSQATQVSIQLARLASGEVELTVCDNGVGMNICNVDQTQHFGLLGMRERVQSLRGTFEVESELGKGVKIKVVIPV